MRQPVVTLFFLLAIVFSVNAQEVPDDKCLFNIKITDFEDIPETNAKLIIWDSNDSASFSKEIVSDIDGNSSVMLDQDHAYTVKIFKADTSFTFGGIQIPTHEAGITFNYKFQIKIVSGYTEILELAVHFASNSSEIPSRDRDALDEVYARLEGNPIMRIELASHTDDQGTDENNMRLSQRRSDAVKKYLVSKGIDEARIIAKGYGEKKPKESNETSEGRARNRRTEVRIIKQ